MLVVMQEMQACSYSTLTSFGLGVLNCAASHAVED